MCFLAGKKCEVKCSLLTPYKGESCPYFLEHNKTLKMSCASGAVTVPEFYNETEGRCDGGEYTELASHCHKGGTTTIALTIALYSNSAT